MLDYCCVFIVILCWQVVPLETMLNEEAAAWNLLLIHDQVCWQTDGKLLAFCYLGILALMILQVSVEIWASTMVGLQSICLSRILTLSV